MGAVFASMDRDDDVLSLGINRAVDLLARKLASVRTLGPHPADNELVAVRKGRFGPFVKHGNTVANLPRGVMMDDISLEEAVALLAEKGKQLRPRGAAGRRARGAANGEAAPATPARKSKGASAAKPKPARGKTAAKRAAPAKAKAKKPTAQRAASGKKKRAAGKAPPKSTAGRRAAE
jgi:DNA topoisomerase-1